MKRTGDTRARGRTLAWQLLIVVVAGFVLRLVYVLHARANDPLFFAPQMDALYHHRWALAVRAGVEFINDAYFRAPLYPLFLGLCYRLFGPDLFAVRVAQALLGAANCGLVYLIARRIGVHPNRISAVEDRIGQRQRLVPLVSGLAMACYPMALYFDGELLIPALLVPLVLAGLLLLLRSLELDRQWLLPGLAFGLAAICRPNVLAFVAAAVIWLFLKYRGQAWKPVLLVLIGVSIPITPVTVRNCAKSGRLVPIAWQAGTNFYIGNNPNSDGVTAVLPGTRASWWGGYNDVKRAAELAQGRALSGPDIDRHWLGKGLEFWQQQPGKAIALTLRKTYLFFAGFEVSNNRDIYFFKQFTFLDALVFRTPFFKFPFGLLVPLAVMGAYVLRRRWRQFLSFYLFTGAYALSFIVFFVTARYRMPLVPLLLMLAVAGVFELARLRGGKLLTPLVLFVVSFAFFNLDLAGRFRPNLAQAHFLAGTGLEATGRTEAALEQLHKALEHDSALNVLELEATLLLAQGRPEPAERAALAAVRLGPDDPETHGAAGNVFASLGRLELASRYFQRAVELDPNSVETWNNLGNVALQRNDLESARKHYERALEIDPAFATALFHLGFLEYREGRKEKAHELWRRVLKLEPNHARAKKALETLR